MGNENKVSNRYAMASLQINVKKNVIFQYGKKLTEGYGRTPQKPGLPGKDKLRMTGSSLSQHKKGTISNEIQW